MSAKKYRKKPVCVEAWEFRPGHEGVDGPAIAAWCGGRYEREAKASDPTDVWHGIRISTLEGVMTADAGDFIIRGVKGEFYPIKEAIFRETYEPVEES